MSSTAEPGSRAQKRKSECYSSSPGGQLTLLEPLGDLARGQPSPIDPGGLAGELLLFIKSYGTKGDSSSLKPLEIAPVKRNRTVRYAPPLPTQHLYHTQPSTKPSG